MAQVTNRGGGVGGDADIEEGGKGKRAAGMEFLLQGDVNRNALPQVTDCWINAGKWLSAYQMAKAMVYLFVAFTCYNLWSVDLKPCNEISINGITMCGIYSPGRTQCTTNDQQPTCAVTCTASQFCMATSSTDLNPICLSDMSVLSPCADLRACLPYYTYQISKSLLYLGMMAIIAMMLEFIGSMSTSSFASMYHEDFEVMTRSGKLYVMLSKLIPYITTAVHIMSAFTIMYAWLIVRDLDMNCPLLQANNGTSFYHSYKGLCIGNMVGWISFVLIGYHMRKNYKVSGDMYFPTTEPNPVICCFDLECTGRLAQSEPRCLGGIYSCVQAAFPERGCEVCGLNKVPKMVMRLGEFMFQGYLFLGQLGLKYLREIHHFGP